MLAGSGAVVPSGGVYGVLGSGCNTRLAAWSGRPVLSTEFKVVRKSLHMFCTLSQLVNTAVRMVWVTAVQKDGDRDGVKGQHTFIILSSSSNAIPL